MVNGGRSPSRIGFGKKDYRRTNPKNVRMDRILYFGTLFLQGFLVTAVSPTFRVLLQKEQLVFSAAHFITFAGDICECLHGHNYGVRGEVGGPLDENRYVIDFIAFRDTLAEVVKQLDHHMLLPTKHPLIQVIEEGEEVIVRFRKKRWVFPAEDCRLLPIQNTTAEEIAAWLAEAVRERIKPKVGDRISYLEIGIDENHGQWGYCRIPW
jgi:6-pyruvoyltetrahydropterin/6-carboxytetrahydropterin synthase